MNLRFHYLPFIILAYCLLSSVAASPIHAQVVGIIDDASDDEFSYPFDDPGTPEDESIDGIIEDLLHRRTIRAAISEASGMNNGNGVPVNLNITATGTIVLTQGPLYPTDGSKIWSTSGITIDASNTSTAIEFGARGTLDGVNFINGDFQVGVDSECTVRRCTFAFSRYNGLTVAGRWNIIGGDRETEANSFFKMGQHGLHLVGDSNWVMGNYIGTDSFGTSLGNKFGIFINGKGNTIGDLQEENGNVIASNDRGISIAGDTTTGAKDNLIIGNYIGAVPRPFPDTIRFRGNQIGIELISAKNNQIGDLPPTDTSEHPENQIYANTLQGILVGYDAVGTDRKSVV